MQPSTSRLIFRPDVPSRVCSVVASSQAVAFAGRPLYSSAVTRSPAALTRLVDDPDGAVWYGARRIFVFALMIYNAIPSSEIER